jgi:putative FmdB family regulatory protein
MPIYEYQCEQCGRVEEVLQKFNEKPLTKCSHCHGKLHKLISQSAFHLKGSGWYVTDYAGKKQKNTKDSDSSNAAVADKSADGNKADTKKQDSE